METAPLGYRKRAKQLLNTIAAFALVASNAHTAASFELRPSHFYFPDSKTQALVAAVMAGNMTMAKQLVADGANPNDEGPPNNPYKKLRPLHFAIAANDRNAVTSLVSLGADPELSGQGCGRSFLFAMTLENLEMLSLLLDLRPIYTLSRQTIGYMLFEAVRQDRYNCLELFLKRGAPIDFPDRSGYTALMRAMDAQDYDMAEWLLLKGASVDIKAGGGITPAYAVQLHLDKYQPGSPTYGKVLHLKELMVERGAVFPAPSPAEVPARRETR